MTPLNIWQQNDFKYCLLEKRKQYTFGNVAKRVVEYVYLTNMLFNILTFQVTKRSQQVVYIAINAELVKILTKLVELVFLQKCKERVLYIIMK